jgi:hypothetical protein
LLTTETPEVAPRADPGDSKLMAAARESEPESGLGPPDLVSLMLAATPAARSCCDARAEPSLAKPRERDAPYVSAPSSEDG